MIGDFRVNRYARPGSMEDLFPMAFQSIRANFDRVDEIVGGGLLCANHHSNPKTKQFSIGEIRQLDQDLRDEEIEFEKIQQRRYSELRGISMVNMRERYKRMAI